MKIHESVMFVLGLVNEGAHVHSTLKKLYGRDSQRMDLEGYTLVISEGVAVRTKSRATGGGLRSTDVKATLMGAALHSHVANMAVAAGEEGSVWHHAAVSLQEKDATADSCAFQDLSVEHTDHSVELGQLHHVAKSQTPAACFAALVAALASRPTVSDIRFHTPKKTSNFVTRGIMQTEVRATNYPYSAANITGAGQVIGIGKSRIMYFLGMTSPLCRCR